jgi:NADPH:quinone reductase-like Zn-dependent oxidoreductase
VYAAGVNPLDWKMRQGSGPARPAQFPSIPGADLAGLEVWGDACRAGGPPLQEKAQAYGVEAVKMMLQASSDLLRTITKLIEAGQIKTAGAKTVPLSEAKLAHKLSQGHHGRGRMVLHDACLVMPWQVTSTFRMRASSS